MCKVSKKSTFDELCNRAREKVRLPAGQHLQFEYKCFDSNLRQQIVSVTDDDDVSLIAWENKLALQVLVSGPTAPRGAQVAVTPAAALLEGTAVASATATTAPPHVTFHVEAAATAGRADGQGAMQPPPSTAAKREPGAAPASAMSGSSKKRAAILSPDADTADIRLNSNGAGAAGGPSVTASDRALKVQRLDDVFANSNGGGGSSSSSSNALPSQAAAPAVVAPAVASTQLCDLSNSSDEEDQSAAGAAASAGSSSNIQALLAAAAAAAAEPAAVAVLLSERETLAAERLHSRTAGRQEALDEAASQEQEPEVEHSSADDSGNDDDGDEQQMYSDDSDVAAGSDDPYDGYYFTEQEEQESAAARGQPHYIVQGLTAEHAEHMQTFLRQLLVAACLTAAHNETLTVRAQHTKHALQTLHVPRAARTAEMDTLFRQWHREVSCCCFREGACCSCAVQQLPSCSTLRAASTSLDFTCLLRCVCFIALQVREDMGNDSFYSVMGLSSKASKVLQEAAHAYKQQVQAVI
jgi:hypothetical protein